MAVCVLPEGYGEYSNQLCYGTPYPGAHATEGADMQVMSVAAMPQGAWSNGIVSDGAAVPFWQDSLEQSEFSTTDNQGDEWHGSQGQGGWNAAPPVAGVWGGCSNLTLPLPPRGGHSMRQKRRFCTSFPEVSSCRRGSQCSFAHSREEIRAPLLSIEEEKQERSAMTDDFFMYKYKTLWCPIGVQHEWHTCVYAHNYQDARRPVSIGYGAKLCPYWSKKDAGAEYSQRCPLGLRCPYSHGAKEQLYHPQYFKTVTCRDLRAKACPRHGLCAFWHQRSERRVVAPTDDVDYSQPLREEALQSDWITEFLTPPFLPESSKGNEEASSRADSGSNGNGMAITPYTSQGPPSPHYGMQQPLVFLLPMSPMSPGAPQLSSSPVGQPGMSSPMGGGQMDIGNQMAPQWVFFPVEGHQTA